MTINISGILRTPSGAVLQNAEILFEQTRTSLEVLAGTDYSLITTSAGAYQTAIGIGTYTLKVRFQEDIQYRQIASNVIVIPSMQNYTINQIIAEQTGLENVDYDVLEEVLQARDAALAAQAQALVSQNAAQGSATQAQSSQSQANTSKNAAQVSQTQAQSSQTAAQGSAATASTKASEASTSQTNAAASEAQALASKNAQATSETNAQSSAAQALSSKNAAQTSANTANTKANEASASQTAAQQSQQDALVSKNQAQASASTASTKASEASTSQAQALASKNAAQTSETNAAQSQAQALTSKNAAQASATSASGSATTATNKAAEASTSATAAADSQATATTKATEASSSAAQALTSKNAAQASATQAQASQTSATNSATTATTKAGEAAASATSAQASAATATTKASQATTSATAAQTSATLAQQWAANPEDSEVSGGLFSARHYAAKAAQASQAANGQLIWMGGWSAQAGNPPPEPLGNTQDFYRITQAGTILGTPYDIGDYIHWDNLNEIWFKMDGTDSVTTVNGQSGQVIITQQSIQAAPAGFGLGGVGASLSGLSCNSATESGFYQIYSGTTDTPYGSGPSGSTMVVSKWGASGVMQTFYSYISDRVHVRRMYTGVWQPWFELYSTQSKPTAQDIGAVGLVGNQIMDGQLTIRKPNASSQLVLDAYQTYDANIVFRSLGVSRWQLWQDNQQESGSNSGSNFKLRAYNDAGASLGDVLSVTRQTLVTNFSKVPTVTAVQDTQDNQLARVDYVNSKVLQSTGGTGVGTNPNATTITGGVRDFDLAKTNGTFTVEGSWANGVNNDQIQASHTGILEVSQRSFDNLTIQKFSYWATAQGSTNHRQYTRIWVNATEGWAPWVPTGIWESVNTYRTGILRRNTVGSDDSIYPYVSYTKENFRDTIPVGTAYTIGEISFRANSANRYDPHTADQMTRILGQVINTATTGEYDGSLFLASRYRNGTTGLTGDTSTLQINRTVGAEFTHGAKKVQINTGKVTADEFFQNTPQSALPNSSARRDYVDASVSRTIVASQLLTVNDNLDTLKSPGVYKNTSNAVASTQGLNYPAGLAGTLVVLEGAGVTQRYYVYNSSTVYSRAQYTTGPWTPWIRDYNEAFKPTQQDVGALPIVGGTLTGMLVIDSSGIAHRMLNSSNVQYYQGGSKTDDQIQNMAFSGYNGKNLTMAKFYMQDTVSPVVRWGTTDHTVYHQGNKPTQDQLGVVPSTRTVNSKALSQNITLTAQDVSAAPQGYGLGGVGTAIASCNDAVMSGFYMINGSTTDTPLGSGPSGSTMVVTRWSSTAISQMFFLYGANAAGDRIFSRTMYGGIWKAWFELYSTSKIPTVQEIGTYSTQQIDTQLGLKADSSELLLKVSKTGDTMTGALTATQFLATNNYAFTSQTTTHGMYLGNTVSDKRLILGGGDTSLGAVYIRPQGIATEAAQTIFNTDGTITNGSAPTAVGHLTNKTYVDTLIGQQVSKTGDTMTGQLIVQSSSNLPIAIKSTTAGVVSPLLLSGVDSTGASRWYVGQGAANSADVLLYSYGHTAYVRIQSDQILHSKIPTTAAQQGVLVNSLTRKDYVDTLIAQQVARAGDTLISGATLTMPNGGIKFYNGSGGHWWTGSKAASIYSLSVGQDYATAAVKFSIDTGGNTSITGSLIAGNVITGCQLTVNDSYMSTSQGGAFAQMYTRNVPYRAYINHTGSSYQPLTQIQYEYTGGYQGVYSMGHLTNAQANPGSFCIHHISSAGSSAKIWAFDGQTGGLSVPGIVQATDFTVTSDIRIKSNLKQVVKPSEKLKKLVIATYDKYSDATKETFVRREMGIIANSQQQADELLVTQDGEGILSNNMGGLVALLTATVQELMAKVEALEERLNGRS